METKNIITGKVGEKDDSGAIPVAIILSIPVAIILFLLMAGVANAAVYECDSCTNCTEKINSAEPGDIVYLTEDITGSKNCIEFDHVEGVTFDCQGNWIESDSVNFGIHLRRSSSNTIKNCFISGFGYGIFLYHSDNNALTKNTAIYNCLEGILLLSSSSNTLTGNTANSNNLHGIYLISSKNNILIENTANSNDIYGIRLYGRSNNNILTGNTANSNGQYGIYLDSSNHNILNSSYVCSNAESDFYLIDSNDNSGDDNTCDNPDGWDDEGEEGCTYSCPAAPPTAAFSADKTSASIYEEIQFTDESTGAASREWDFGDGDGSTDQNPTHTYTEADTYTVSLTVRNDFGEDTASMTINVTFRCPWDVTSDGRALSNDATLVLKVAIGLLPHGDKGICTCADLEDVPGVAQCDPDFAEENPDSEFTCPWDLTGDKAGANDAILILKAAVGLLPNGDKGECTCTDLDEVAEEYPVFIQCPDYTPYPTA